MREYKAASLKKRRRFLHILGAATNCDLGRTIYELVFVVCIVLNGFSTCVQLTVTVYVVRESIDYHWIVGKGFQLRLGFAVDGPDLLSGFVLSIVFAL